MQGNLLCMMYFPFDAHYHHPGFVARVVIDGNLVNMDHAAVHIVEEDNGHDRMVQGVG